MVNNTSDLKFGLENENSVLTFLKEKVNIDIIKTPKFHFFDFFSPQTNTYYELKTRRVKHNTYPDTMCGANKLNFAEQNPENKYIFLYKFTDGLYYHEWDTEKQYEIRVGGRCDRGKIESSNYFYIKREDLKTFRNN